VSFAPTVVFTLKEEGGEEDVQFTGDLTIAHLDHFLEVVFSLELLVTTEAELSVHVPFLVVGLGISDELVDDLRLSIFNVVKLIELPCKSLDLGTFLFLEALSYFSLAGFLELVKLSDDV